MIKEESLEFLEQLTGSLEKTALKLEQAYNNRNHEDFNKLKKLIIQLQKKILEIVE